MGESIHIAILGDLHGHFTLAYTLLRRWEQESGHKLALILQVGDLGAFPPPFRLDKATLRFSKKDRDEISFIDYWEGSDEADVFLDPESPDAQRIDADMVFIRGNHEDFIYLDEVRSQGPGPTPVDAYGRIHYLPSGDLFEATFGGVSVKIAGLGGINHFGEHGHDPLSVNYTRADVRRLRKHCRGADIFLSHDVPFGAGAALNPRYERSGSKDVLDLIRDLKPKLHFCGHYHEPGQSLGRLFDTESYHLHEVSFRRAHQLNPGCIGIVKTDGVGRFEVEVLDEPWMAEYTKWNFRQLAGL